MDELQVSALSGFAKRHPAPVLLDVREPWETALASIDLPGVTTLRVPMAQIPLRLADIPALQPVVCICHHGVRSAQVVAFLLHVGRTDVYNLRGGVEAWAIEVDPTMPRY